MTSSSAPIETIPEAVLNQVGLLSKAALSTLGPAHETLTHPERGDYLEKWRLTTRNDGSATMIHRFLRSDGDHEMHDHPWDNRTLVLTGGYWEVTPAGRRWLGPGAIVNRRAGEFHRVELEPGIQPVTLFWHGPKINDWGFRDVDGTKVPADEFIARSASQQ